ncbi:MAG: hypothetical protein EHM70_12305, partial [Chloroflexota bacterium]
MLTDQLTKEEISYLDTWMNKVSRSFAVVVAALEEPLKTQMATAYLLCRVIDNIEDCTASITWKKKRFVEIAQLLVEPEIAPDILSSWDAEPWPGLTQDERKLMSYKYGSSLLRIFFRFTDEVRTITRSWIIQMIDGMSHLQEPTYEPKFVQYNGVQVLAAEQD